jgi:hypothetical protein
MALEPLLITGEEDANPELADMTRRNRKAIVRGKVEVFGIEHRGVAHGALQDRRLQVVDHDFVWKAPKEVKRVLMARQKVLVGPHLTVVE